MYTTAIAGSGYRNLPFPCWTIQQDKDYADRD